MIFIFQESSATLEKYFPLLSLVASSPAFQRGNVRFTSNDEVFQVLKNISEKSPHAIYKEMELESIPYLIIAENRNYNPGKPTVWIEAMQHGDEPGSGEAALGLAEFFSLNPAGYLQSMNIIIVPRLNTTGENRLSGNIDMNMDHALLAAPETRALKREVMRYNPEFFIDLHEYPASEEAFSIFSKDKILPYYDILISPPTNRNVRDAIKDQQKQHLQIIKSNLEKNGVRIGAYYNGVKQNDQGITLQVPSSSIKIARNAFALIPTYSYLIEGRGKDLGLKLFQRRVGSLEESVVGFLNLYKKQGSDIKRHLTSERVKIKNEKNTLAVLATGGEVYSDNFNFLDRESETVKNYRVNMRADFSKTGGIIRSKPFGYVLNSNERDIIRKLDAHMIHYTPLEKDTVFSVEQYRVSNDNRGYTLEKSQKMVPAGNIIIELNQLQNILIMLLFEPESEANFLNMNLLSRRGEYLPYSRIISK